MTAGSQRPQETFTTRYIRSRTTGTIHRNGCNNTGPHPLPWHGGEQFGPSALRYMIGITGIHTCRRCRPLEDDR